jgi:ketosteroid isomerase-like protein
MTNIDWTHGTEIAPDELPEAITTYLPAHRARDLDTAMAHYSADAAVTDEARTYRGTDQIRAWLATSATQYTYTVKLTGALRIDGDHYDARHHLEGNFPGGVADLHFRFTLRDGLIASLVIEP